MKIDLADPAQHRFVMNRLAAAGKTADNSPYLFERLQASTDKALARGKNGTASVDAATAFCAHFVHLGTEVKDTTNIKFDGAAPTVSCMDGAAYVYTDITTFNANRAGTESFLVGAASGEDYSGATDFAAVEISPLVPGVRGRVNRTESLVMAYDALGNEQIELRTVKTEILPTPGSINLQHPFDHPGVANGVRTVQMCQLRGAENECDYRIGNLSAAGSFAPFGSPINGIAGVKSVNPWIGDTSQFFPFTVAFNSSHLYLPALGIIDVGETAVGSCSIKSIAAAKLSVFKRVRGGQCQTSASFTSAVLPTLNTRKATFTTIADFTNDGGSGIPARVNCSHAEIVNDTVRPTMIIVANVNCGEKNPDGTPLIFQRTIIDGANGRTATPFRVNFLNSCFAEGTPVRRANGTVASVEKLKVGDKVISDSKGTILTVTSTAHGTEDQPLVSLRDNKGHKLQLTTKHPVLLASGEVVHASTVKVGDQVMTDRGIAKIVSAERMPYGGQVYNLALGTAAEKAKVGVNGTTMFAGGFLVGDSAMQTEHSRAKAPVAAVLPAWRRDFEAGGSSMTRILR
jgi:hypothetical protein